METTKNKNYYTEFLNKYREINLKTGRKQKLLLHVCCGACSLFPLLLLSDVFDITIFYSNSNIDTFEEFNKRLEALKKYLLVLKKKEDVHISLVVDDYNYEEFREHLLPLKDEREGQKRCRTCISLRILKLFEYAKENNFVLVTTIMSVSRNKDGKFINEFGKSLEAKFKNIEYLAIDFKKNNGQDIGVNLSKVLDIYRQNYCGCEFSKRHLNNPES